jgi:hypothetical protein
MCHYRVPAQDERGIVSEGGERRTICDCSGECREEINAERSRQGCRELRNDRARKQKTRTKMECIGRMTARIELLACKNRKTNEIWLLGEVSESGTLDRS